MDLSIYYQNSSWTITDNDYVRIPVLELDVYDDETLGHFHATITSVYDDYTGREADSDLFQIKKEHSLYSINGIPLKPLKFNHNFELMLSKESFGTLILSFNLTLDTRTPISEDTDFYDYINKNDIVFDKLATGMIVDNQGNITGRVASVYRQSNLDEIAIIYHYISDNQISSGEIYLDSSGSYDVVITSINDNVTVED